MNDNNFGIIANLGKLNKELAKLAVLKPELITMILGEYGFMGL